jgi:hypothetical protein
MQAYSNPKRASDPYSLPDVEVFYDDADSVNGHARNFDGEGNPVEAGWYWWSCFPGCLPNSDPVGPFATAQEALADAQEGVGEFDEDEQDEDKC